MPTKKTHNLSGLHKNTSHRKASSPTKQTEQGRSATNEHWVNKDTAIRSGDGRVLGSLDTRPNVRRDFARPDTVTGRMKPTKFRKALRQMARVAAENPDQTDAIEAGIRSDLDDARR